MSRISMFDRICSSNKVIVSQQRHESDLTREQKYEHLERLYSMNPSNFIYRFGSLLTDDELREQFDPNADYIQQITKRNHQKLRTNRRYAYMQELLANGTYFSEEEMKERSPLLYEQMIGKYQDENGRSSLVKRTAQGPLADFYMEHLEALQHQERVEKELENEESFDEDENEIYSNKERDFYRNEFLAIHKEKFLNGEDSNIDYHSIDNNENFDNIQILEQDEQERYFDED